MARLHEGGYQTLRLMEASDFLRRGAPFPERSFVITFDDGYQSVFDEAFPVLEGCGMSATVFLTVGEKGGSSSRNRLPSLTGRVMLSWEEIKEMQQSGMDFGAHTLTHPDLTRVPFDRVKAEVYDGKSMIEDALGTQVTSFAYPYGRYNDRVRDVVREHFGCACSDKLGLVRQGSDLYAPVSYTHLRAHET